MPAARDRQELGQALHDAQHGRLDQIHVTSFPWSARGAIHPVLSAGPLRGQTRQKRGCGGQRSAAHEGGGERALPEGTGDRDGIGGGSATTSAPVRSPTTVAARATGAVGDVERAGRRGRPPAQAVRHLERDEHGAGAGRQPAGQPVAPGPPIRASVTTACADRADRHGGARLRQRRLRHGARRQPAGHRATGEGVARLQRGRRDEHGAGGAPTGLRRPWPAGSRRRRARPPRAPPWPPTRGRPVGGAGAGPAGRRARDGDGRGPRSHLRGR